MSNENIGNANLPETALYDAIGHSSLIALLAGLVQTDPTTNDKYAPAVQEDILEYLRLNGQGFSASTDLITGANTAYYAMSIFNPSSAKNILITRFVAVIQAASTNFDAFLTTADPAFATALTPLNMKAGSATASIASVTATPGSANIGSLPGSKKFRESVAPAGTEWEMLKNGTVILLPAGAANGTSLYLYNPGASDKFSFFADWVEF